MQYMDGTTGQAMGSESSAPEAESGFGGVTALGITMLPIAIVFGGLFILRWQARPADAAPPGCHLANASCSLNRPSSCAVPCASSAQASVFFVRQAEQNGLSDVLKTMRQKRDRSAKRKGSKVRAQPPKSHSLCALLALSVLALASRELSKEHGLIHLSSLSSFGSFCASRLGATSAKSTSCRRMARVDAPPTRNFLPSAPTSRWSAHEMCAICNRGPPALGISDQSCPCRHQAIVSPACSDNS